MAYTHNVQMLPGSNISRSMARTGVDWICVDTEHGNVDGMSLENPKSSTIPLTHLVDGQMHEAVAAIAACGVSPVVRIAANESWMVKRRGFPFSRQGTY